MSNHVEDYKHFQKITGDLMKACPDVMKAFGGVHQASIKDAAVSTKYKELIAIGISVAIRCTACIDAHVKAALDAGATAEEISEAVGVAILMAGGPGTAYGALAIEALNQFTEK